MNIDCKKLKKVFVLIRTAFLVSDMVNVAFGGKPDKKYLRAKGVIKNLINECQGNCDKEKIEYMIKEFISEIE